MSKAANQPSCKGRKKVTSVGCNGVLCVAGDMPYNLPNISQSFSDSTDPFSSPHFASCPKTVVPLAKVRKEQLKVA